MRSRLVVMPLMIGLVIVATPRPAPAWGGRKYIMLRAIALLPREIRPFFEKYQTTIVEHVIVRSVADRRVGAGTASAFSRHGRMRSVPVSKLPTGLRRSRPAI